MKIIEHELKQNKSHMRFWLESNGFRRIRSYYSNVYEMTNCLNKMFGLSQVTGVCFCFYIILTDLNWLLTYFDELFLVFAISKSCSKNKVKIILQQ